MVNVRDFGAKGDGIADDTAAFQGAIDQSVQGPDGEFRRKTVYVPPGTYKITAALVMDNVQGQGVVFGSPGASFLNANFAGFIFDNNDNTKALSDGVIEGLTIKNVHAGGGGVRYRGADNIEVRNCAIQCGLICVQLGGTEPADTCFDSKVSNCRLNGVSSTPASGTIGAMLGPETAIQNCGIVNFDHGIRCYGAGGYIIGCRIEVNNTGVFFGQDVSGNSFSATGWVYMGGSMEGNKDGIYILAASDLLVAGLEISFGSNAPPGGTGSSRSGLHFFSGDTITFIGVGFNGAYTTAGVWIEGQPGTLGSTVGLNSLDCNTSSFLAGAGVSFGNCWQEQTQGFPTFADTFAHLPGNMPEGTRRMITNCSTSTFGAAADGAGSLHVPVYRDNVGWKVG